LDEIYSIIPKDEILLKKYPKDFILINLLRKNLKILKMFESRDHYKKLIFFIDKNKNELEEDESFEEIKKDNINLIIADKTYCLSNDIFSLITKQELAINRFDLSNKIDKIILNPFLEYPILILVAYFVFKFTFLLSEPLIRFFDFIFSRTIFYLSTYLNSFPILKSLVIDGIFAGASNLIMLVPIIFFLFLIFSILENIGYMSRIVFSMDKFMHKIGLNGRSFISMMFGFGCNIPAMISSRTIKSNNERVVTILINPFISCGARLSIYLLFINLFFEYKYRHIILFGLYVVGIIVSIITSKILKKFIFNKNIEDFVMELPTYKMFSLKTVFLFSYQQIIIYFKRIAVVILFGSILFWALSIFPLSSNVNNVNNFKVQNINNKNDFKDFSNNYVTKLGKFLVPIFTPIGFEDWRIPVSFISGIFAKEMVVSTLSTLYSVSDIDKNLDLKTRLSRIKKQDGSLQYNKLTSILIMLFVLLSFPCLGALMTIKKETQSWFWAGVSLVYGFAIAWTVCFFVYNIFKFLV